MGKAHARVHRVVDGGAAVPIASDRQHDQVLALLAQVLVGEPAAGGQVREKDPRVLPGSADEIRHELLAARGTQIDPDGSLALVEATPVQALAVFGERPALVVEASADGVEADHLGAELAQRHARQWRGDEGGALHDAQSLQDSRHSNLLTL